MEERIDDWFVKLDGDDFELKNLMMGCSQTGFSLCAIRKTNIIAKGESSISTEKAQYYLQSPLFTMLTYFKEVIETAKKLTPKIKRQSQDLNPSRTLDSLEFKAQNNFISYNASLCCNKNDSNRHTTEQTSFCDNIRAENSLSTL